MKVKCFYPDKNGNIVLTKSELEKLLNDVYDEGYSDGEQSSNPTITYRAPLVPYTPYYYNKSFEKTIDTTPVVYCTSDDSIGRTIIEKNARR